MCVVCIIFTKCRLNHSIRLYLCTQFITFCIQIFCFIRRKAIKFNKLITDTDKRVRLSMSMTLMCLCKKLKREIAPQLKHIIAHWLSSHYDPHQETANILKESFDVYILFLTLE